MKYLRTVSTRRLLATLAGLVVAVAGGTAIAVAASGPGPVPPRSGLAQALHKVLGAPAVTGLTARIKFTNNLIDTSAIQGSDPILTGASGRLWLSGNHQLRLELQSNNGDAEVLVNHGSFWISDRSSNTVYEGTLPQSKGTAKTGGTSKQDKLLGVAQIQSDLNRLMGHVNVSGAMPSDVAQQAAYTVRMSPKHDGGLLGSAEVAWDAARGVPLRFAVYARGNTTPVLALEATDISYGAGAVAPSDFAIRPPAGAKVVKISTTGPGTASDHAARTKAKAHRGQVSVSGAAAVARRLPFTLVAPNKLVGLPRQTVKLLDWGGKPAALIAYGQNLGGMAVIEQSASTGSTANSATKSQSAGQGGGSALSLPTVSINGATGQELDTALGTMVRFTRGGVAYTVLGSVPAVAADLAARAL
jgi:outer membrane lipoprotein-sorting protein